MTRRFFIERLRRQIYGGMPSDDAQVSVNLVNAYVGEGIAYAAKQNYVEGLKLEGVAYLNNAFYTTYTNLTVVKDGNSGAYKITLPSTPIGIGSNEDINSLAFVDSKGNVSDNVIVVPISEYAYHKKLRQPQNKIIASYENGFALATSAVPLWKYKAKIRMASGGGSEDLDSELNIPASYMPSLNEYVLRQLTTMRIQKKDNNNDGNDEV